ncbi:ASB11, partial [Cervus elaphus hippelaphus]
VNGVTVHGATPLFNACCSGSAACVNVLLEFGAKAQLEVHLASPIHEAVKRAVRTDAPFTPEPVQMENRHVQSIAAFQRRKGPPMGSTIEKILDTAAHSRRLDTSYVRGHSEEL